MMMPLCGLYTLYNFLAIPLTGVHYNVDVKSFAGHVTINQTYKNTGYSDLECVYAFPISDQASVVGLTVRIGNRTLTSAFKKKEEAVKEYTDAVAQGNGAYLLQQSERSDDTFQLKVGRLPAGQECTVSISYVATLESVNEKKMRLTIPTALTPRYNPSSQLTSQNGPSDRPANYQASVSYQATLSGHIDAMDNIQTVMSPTHQLSVTQPSPKEASIQFSAKQRPLDRDLVIEIELKNNPQSYVEVEETAPGEYTAMYAFTPHFEPGKSVNSELIFVVDCSGSMAMGTQIEDARRAMHIFLRSIPEGAYFNFYLFGSSFTSLFPGESQPYNSNTFNQAHFYATSIDSDMDGTEVLSPLKNIYSTPPKPGFSRQIFVLTDGEVSNTQEVIELVRKNAPNSRVFAFGLGDSPSRSLVNGIAAAGNGKAEFIKTGELLEKSVGRQLSRALQPAVTDVAVEIKGGKDVQQAPKVLPPVFKGDRQLVYAMFKLDNSTGTPATPPFLELTVGGAKLKVPFKIPTSNSTTKPFLSKLAARELIRELELNAPAKKPLSTVMQSILDDEKVQPSENGDETAKKVTELSLKHGVLSKQVSLIAVEYRNATKEDGEVEPMKVVEIPIEKPQTSSQPQYGGYGGGLGSGYGGVVGAGGSGSAPQQQYNSQNMPMVMYNMNNGGSGGKLSSISSSGGSGAYSAMAAMMQQQQQQQQSQNSAEVGRPAASAPAVSPGPMNRLLNLQQWDGTWALTEELAQLGNVSVNQLQDLAKATPTVLENNVMGTVLAVNILEKKFPEMRDAWLALVTKAKDFLAKQADQASLQEFSKSVLALITNN